MIKFFRRIRFDVMENNNTGKYLKYAIGEIILVVVGILLALSINNWNSGRIEQNSIINYYERISIELDQEIASAKRQKKDNNTLIHKNQRALRILNSKNLDSLEVLKNLLGATATNWTSQYSFPITNEFLKQGYLSKIKNDSLKACFKNYSKALKYIEYTNNYNNVQYQNTIEPFFIKNINYTEIALKDYRKDLIKGGPRTEFAQLYDNLEMWNILTFKLESLKTESNRFDGTVYVLEKLKSQIESELTKG